MKIQSAAAALAVLGTWSPALSGVFEPVFQPTLSPAPTTECGSSRQCTINPDPHFNIFDEPIWYDFQGGCDMIAIDNPVLQVQIRTRPRGTYSTITQVAVEIKATGEVLKMKVDGTVDNTIGNSGVGLATYSAFGEFHTIALGNEAEKSYIRIYQRSYGITMVANGCTFYFAGSEGMCGSWDDGGVNLSDGTPIDLSGDQGDDDKKARAFALAQSWMIDPAESHLWDPSTICDPTANCGPTGGGEGVFPCNAVRNRRLQVNPGCTLTCADINIEQYREQCELDVLSTGDPSWACADAYINTPTNWCELFDKSDDDLVAMGLAKELGTYCYIQESQGGTACNYYVKGRPSDSDANGLPLTNIGLGTGCVDEDGGSCFFQDPSYPLTQAERESMCTTSWVANAAAQLRYGIANGYCMDDPTQRCTETPTDWCALLEESDDDLYALGLAKEIGTYCHIQESHGGTACNYYVKGRPSDVGANGVPLTDIGLGTGCVDEDGGFCFFQNPSYPLTQAERDSMCTVSHVANAAAQLRYGIRNGLCMDDPTEACAAPAPTPAPTPPDWCALLEESDDDLYALGLAKQLGTYCYIQESHGGTACNYYVKGRPSAAGGNGLPLTTDGRGTGCVDEDGGSCFFYSSAYPLTQAERDSMCTVSHVANAAAQLRYGIRNGYCMDDPTEACNVPAEEEGSGQWYVDWTLNSGTCVKDCIGSAPCRERLKQNHEPGYANEGICCSTIDWQPSASCHL